MKAKLLILGLATVCCFSCKKEDATPPAIKVYVTSLSYPPSEENGYMFYTATVELKKTDGTFADEQYISGTGTYTFEHLAPGEYWINEQTSRHSELLQLNAGETKEIYFYIP